MHYNTLFQDRNLKNFGRKKPLSRPHHTPRRLRRLDRRAFGAPHLALSALSFMRPVFSVPIVGDPILD